MTAQEKGLLGLILVCPHREDKVFAARGFRHAANNYGAAQVKRRLVPMGCACGGGGAIFVDDIISY